MDEEQAKALGEALISLQAGIQNVMLELSAMRTVTIAMATAHPEWQKVEDAAVELLVSFKESDERAKQRTLEWLAVLRSRAEQGSGGAS